ncbi:NAD(P)H-hydrate dehydratase [Candidatus Woesearchaeota archaeon]|nr:NAD(P)H-hydrate dehydratase [Candidatus Woesearchaeota archaeon]
MKLIEKRGEYKGENGKVLIIGGSKDYIGAPAVAALAALRTGIDLSVVAAPEQAAWTINSMSPDLITRKLEGDFLNWDNVKDVIELAENFHVILIGNGIGLEPGTMDLVKEVVERLPQPKVIDADALKALQYAEFTNAVLTPHSKEFEILTDEKLPEDLRQRAELVRHFARKDKIFILKSPVDIITDGSAVKYNKTGNSGMTIGGTGDVLAGITAGLIAQGGDLFNSAVAAAELNGKIGDYLLKKKGIGFTASDMIELIPVIKKKMKI